MMDIPPTRICEILEGDMSVIEAGTNTPRGKDGVTLLRIRTENPFAVITGGVVRTMCKDLQLEFYGDDDALMLIKALKFALSVCEHQRVLNAYTPGQDHKIPYLDYKPLPGGSE
jgi:hypothetical protein